MMTSATMAKTREDHLLKLVDRDLSVAIQIQRVEYLPQVAFIPVPHILKAHAHGYP